MNESSASRRRKLEKISFEEVMGAAGMSGFGALVQPPHNREEPGGQLLAALRVRVALRGAALAEKLARQNDAIRSLNQPMTNRVTSLMQVLRFCRRLRLSRASQDSLPVAKGAAHSAARSLTLANDSSGSAKRLE